MYMCMYMYVHVCMYMYEIRTLQKDPVYFPNTLFQLHMYMKSGHLTIKDTRVSTLERFHCSSSATTCTCACAVCRTVDLGELGHSRVSLAGHLLEVSGVG